MSERSANLPPGAVDTGDGHGEIRPREGSTLHYALLWTPPEARARFLDRLALVRALATTLDDVHDPGVAEHKVHWWHEELERLAGGTPRHPRTAACADTLGGLGDATAALLDVLSVAATTRYTPPADDAERRERLVRDHGARLALLAHALGDDARALTDPAVRHPELAVGLGLHEALARLPALLHRGFAVFSEAEYARHALTPAALARHVRRDAGPTDAREPDTMAVDASGGDAPRGDTSTAPAPGDGAAGEAGRSLGGIPVVAAPPDRHAIVRASVAEAQAALDAALADPAYHRTYSSRSLAPLARVAALRSRQLRLWRERSPDLLRETVTPTPLAKFLLAWRHRHGARPPPGARAAT